MRAANNTHPAGTPARIATVIADDEPLARDLLANLVRREADLELVGAAATGSEALRAVEQSRPELLLLDIQMPSLDGLSVAEQLASLPRSPYTIFVTAHDAFALQAFEVSVRDYLVKPINRQRFSAAIRRAKYAINTRLAAREEPLIVKQGDTVSSVLPSDIVWVAAANQYVVLHTTHGDEFVLSKTLRQFSKALCRTTFARVHRSTVINTRHLTSVQHRDGRYRVQMSDGSAHALARNRRALLNELLACARENAQLGSGR
ncbi:MAG: LytTR family DNA-binding domain-containing protein [Pseudomonadota bacterium]